MTAIGRNVTSQATNAPTFSLRPSTTADHQLLLGSVDPHRREYLAALPLAARVLVAMNFELPPAVTGEYQTGQNNNLYSCHYCAFSFRPCLEQIDAML